MPRKNTKRMDGETIGFIVGVVIVAIVTLNKFIIENPWTSLVVAGVVAFLFWLTRELSRQS